MTITRERRPQGDLRATEAFRGASPSVSLRRLPRNRTQEVTADCRGVVVVPTWRDPEGRLLAHAVGEPAGTHVVLVVRPGQPAPLMLDELRARGQHLVIEVRCPDSNTRQLWLDTLAWGVAQWIR